MKYLCLAALLLGTALTVHAAKHDLDYERLRASLNELSTDPVLGALAPLERAAAEAALQTLLADSSAGSSSSITPLIAIRNDCSNASFLVSRAIR